MKFLNRKLFFRSLRAKYRIPPSDQYLWDAFEGLRSFLLSARTSQRKLEAATRGLDGVLRVRTPVFVFGDKIAGWSELGMRRQHSPIRVAGLEEALALIHEHGHFRDKRGFVDNYYICDSSFSWFVVFCHENDWHVFLTCRQSARPKFADWVRKNGVRQI